MEFADAVSMLTSGRAAKRTSWGGYVYRTDVGTAGDYKLTFRAKQNNSGGSVVEYVYTYTASTGSFSVTGSSVTMTAEFLEAMLASDWIVGNTTDFETARKGTGTW